MDKKNNEIILFENQGVKLEVNLKDETVWLNRQQLAELFDRDIKTIGKHINNALNEELKDIPTVAKFATVQKEGNREVTRDIEYYNLDVIISVGYRVRSENGVIFRRWANKILKDYMLKGYAVNQKRLEYLEKTGKLEVNKISCFFIYLMLEYMQVKIKMLLCVVQFSLVVTSVTEFLKKEVCDFHSCNCKKFTFWPTQKTQITRIF